jgi:ketosteroid isomerase-like protein
VKIFVNGPLLMLLIATFFVSNGFSQSGGKSRSINEDLEIEVMATIQVWADAMVKRDLKILDAIFSPDLIVTTYDGYVRGKEEELAGLRPVPGVKTVSVANENVRVRFYDKTAVATALTKMVFNVNGKDLNVSLLYTAVFVREGRRWQMVALQTAKASPAAAKAN